MGVTYKAFDTNLHCHVALKIIAPDLLGDQLTRERFQREARVAAAIRHPNVAAVSYLGEEEGEIFYAMEFVEGITLDQEIREHSRLAPSKALEITLQVCRALAALHRQGLVHRDIKPSNIMLIEAGEDELRVKLVDFGLAKFLAGNFTSPALAQASAAGFHGHSLLCQSRTDQRPGGGHSIGHLFAWGHNLHRALRARAVLRLFCASPFPTPHQAATTGSPA